MTNTLDQRVQAAVRDALATTSQNPSAGINAVAAFIASAALAEVHRQPAVVEPPADQTAVLAATLREVLDTFSPMKDTHDGPVAYYDGSADIEPEQYDRWRAVLDAALRRMADETATDQTPAAASDCNAGPGWYEVITSPQATTCIAYVHEDGSLYLPEGDLTEEEFAFAAARGKAHRLVRADEQPAAGARQDEAQP